MTVPGLTDDDREVRRHSFAERGLRDADRLLILAPTRPSLTRRSATLSQSVRGAIVLVALVTLCACVVEPSAIVEPSVIAESSERAGVGGSIATASSAPATASSRTASPPPSETVRAAAGKSTTTTASFRVDDSWMLTWQHSGRALFTIQLIPAGTHSYGDLVLSVVGPAKGSEPMYRGGSFELRVVATGTWRVAVVDVGAWSLESLPLAVTGTGTTNSPVFRVDGPWFVEWSQPRISPIHISLVSVGGDGSWVLADTSGAAGSCAAPRRSGRFYIHIVAVGPWRLRLSEWDGTELVCPI